MEEDTLTAQIPSNFYALLAVFIVAMFLIGGLMNIDIEVTEAQKTQYRQAAVLENVMALDANKTEFEKSGITPYNYSQRRAYIPLEFFTNRLGENENRIGFYAEEVNFDTDSNCYLPKVPGLNSETFAYRLDIMKSESEGYANIPGECEEQRPTNQGELENAVFSQALLVRENLDKPPLPVRIYVYAVE